MGTTLTNTTGTRSIRRNPRNPCQAGLLDLPLDATTLWLSRTAQTQPSPPKDAQRRIAPTGRQLLASSRAARARIPAEDVRIDRRSSWERDRRTSFLLVFLSRLFQNPVYLRPNCAVAAEVKELCRSKTNLELCIAQIACRFSCAMLSKFRSS